MIHLNKYHRLRGRLISGTFSRTMGVVDDDETSSRFIFAMAKLSIFSSHNLHLRPVIIAFVFNYFGI